MSDIDQPDICGKPIHELGSGLPTPELADTAGPPSGLFIMSFTTVCILPPNHDGECRDAAVKYATVPPAYGMRLVSDLLATERKRLWEKSDES